MKDLQIREVVARRKHLEGSVLNEIVRVQHMKYQEIREVVVRRKHLEGSIPNGIVRVQHMTNLHFREGDRDRLSREGDQNLQHKNNSVYATMFRIPDDQRKL